MTGRASQQSARARDDNENERIIGYEAECACARKRIAVNYTRTSTFRRSSHATKAKAIREEYRRESYGIYCIAVCYFDENLNKR